MVSFCEKSSFEHPTFFYLPRATWTNNFHLLAYFKVLAFHLAQWFNWHGQKYFAGTGSEMFNWQMTDIKSIWAATWQNQQCGCAPSEDSDQLGIRPVWSESSPCAWRNFRSLATHWAHSEVSGCPGWSKSSLDAHSFCWFCHVVAQFWSMSLWLLFTLLSRAFYK